MGNGLNEPREDFIGTRVICDRIVDFFLPSPAFI